MRKWLMLCVNIIGVVGVAYFFLLRPLAPPPAKPLQSPPEFAFTSLDGGTHHLSDYKGKVILIHFWASWCAPCVEEFPELIALAKSQPEKLAIVAISVDETEAKIQQFIGKKELPKNLIIVHDKDKQISYNLFQTINYPETILVSCNYKMRDKVIGMATHWPATVAPLIAECR
jgi:cytochrome c biogenesis protein CcmG/thiol:disulfide interchange protein DsbE